MRAHAERTGGNHHTGCRRARTFDRSQPAILSKLPTGVERIHIRDDDIHSGHHRDGIHALRRPHAVFMRFNQISRKQAADLATVIERDVGDEIEPGLSGDCDHVLTQLRMDRPAALARAGLERRGEIVRLVMTMRGGDRPKAAHEEFSGVSVMPRSMWEPWLLYRKPLDGRVQDNLRRWGTGGFRRISADKPFGDVIESAPTRSVERKLAAHPSLKPQAFLRHVVRGVLPLGQGVVLDPFAGSGSTLAAAHAVGYESIGVERDATYVDLAREAIPRLAALAVKSPAD